MYLLALVRWLYIFIYIIYSFIFYFLKFKLHTKITDFIFRLFRVSGVGDQFFLYIYMYLHSL